MELRRVIKYRNVWIGVAMLWILLLHSGVTFDSVFLSWVKELGYGGVDICLFASGLGCYYSLERDPDILRFLKRRLKRLGPTYLCFILPWLLWTKKLHGLPIPAAFGNILGVQTLASWDYQFNWYISALVVFYICLPYLKQLTDSCRSWRQDLAVGLLLLAISISFWNTGRNMIVILSRFPVVYAGVAVAKMARQGYILKKEDYLCLGILFASGLALLLYFYHNWFGSLWYCGFHWYPFALIVPGICVFLSAAAERLEKSSVLRGVNRFLGLVGTYSFEVYLVHLFLYEELLPELGKRFGLVMNDALWLLTIPVIACGVFLLNRLGTFAGRLLEGFRNKEKA